MSRVAEFVLILFCLRMHSSTKFLLVSLIIPFARKVPGRFLWRLRECAFIKRLVVCGPKPLGTRMVIVFAKQCFFVLTCRRVRINSIVRGVVIFGEGNVDGLLVVSISVCVAVSVESRRDSICQMRLERNV